MSYPQPRDPSQRHFASRYPAERSPSPPLLHRRRRAHSFSLDESPLASPTSTRDENLSPTSPTDLYNLQPTSPLTWLSEAPAGRQDNITQSALNFSTNSPSESNGLWLHRNIPIDREYTVWGQIGQFDVPTLRSEAATPRVDITQFDFGFTQLELAPSAQSQTQDDEDADIDRTARALDFIKTWVHPALRSETIEKWKRDGLLPRNLPITTGQDATAPFIKVPVFAAPEVPAPVVPVPLVEAPVLSASNHWTQVTPPRRPSPRRNMPLFYPQYGQSLNDPKNVELEERLMCTQRSASQGAVTRTPVTPVSPTRFLVTRGTPVTPARATPVTPITPARRIRPYSPTSSLNDDPVTPPWYPIPDSDSESKGYFGKMDDSPTDNIVRTLPIGLPYQVSPSSTQGAAGGTQFVPSRRQLLPPFSPRPSFSSNGPRSFPTMEGIMKSKEESAVALTEWTPEMYAIIADTTPRSREERRNAFGPEYSSRRRNTRVSQASPIELLNIDTTGLNVLTRTEVSVPKMSMAVPARCAHSRVREGLRKLTNGFRRK
ncbi:hypothetical protein PENANT_c002G10265 [Penicillium antarcticum]|uniref:Uncharacterized protein n=1 Tax=Penicillium antarcticum TaxID=416450 RepID=A0A1V6QLD2_9EURO|nr:hypothetical protein PENANT_c002G10265 [Penicillium antarcticum]